MYSTRGETIHITVQKHIIHKVEKQKLIETKIRLLKAFVE